MNAGQKRAARWSVLLGMVATSFGLYWAAITAQVAVQVALLVTLMIIALVGALIR